MLFGALGLFLFGMRQMSNSLMDLAGSSLRRILASATRNRVMAILVGVLITSVMQSSSVTTVMVVSFSNAALLTLSESIGVIMGANIGTTTTAWIITLFGFEWSMHQLALPLVGLGFALTLGKNDNVRNTGGFVVGFALLFIGLEYLKDSLPNISEHPEMLEIVQRYTDFGFGSVLLFLLIGTLLTLLLQSSSATMAVTLLMCHQGWIPYDLAAAMVLGENIGTTITANIAAFVANVNAKRTALAHVVINVAGVMWMLVLFYPFLHLVDWVVGSVQGKVVAGSTATPLGLTVFHMAFNLTNVVVLFSFIKVIERVVKRVITEPERMEIEEAEPQFINKSALEFPESAISAIEQESQRLITGPVFEIVAHAFNMHRKFLIDETESENIIDKSTEIIDLQIDTEYAHKIKGLYSKIISYGVEIHSSLDLSEAQVRRLNEVLKADRRAVECIKRAEIVRTNINTYMSGNNHSMQDEYNKLRRKIARVLRRIAHIENEASVYLPQLVVISLELDNEDMILHGELDELIKSGAIDAKMASSLVNDTHQTTDICQGLIESTLTLFENHQTAQVVA